MTKTSNPQHQLTTQTAKEKERKRQKTEEKERKKQRSKEKEMSELHLETFVRRRNLGKHKRKRSY